MKKVILLFLLIISFAASAQVKRCAVGIGPVLGYNSCYAEGGVSMVAVLFDHFDINAGLATRKYQGAGISAGWRYYPLGMKYFSPFVSVNYLLMNERRFSVSHGNYFSVYSTPADQYVIPGVGLSYTFGQVDLLLIGNFAFAQNKVHTVNESGFADQLLMNSIDDGINGGAGATVAIYFRPWKNIKKANNEFPVL